MRRLVLVLMTISLFVSSGCREQGTGTTDGQSSGVILLRYSPGSESTEQREQGFLETMLAEYPEIEIISENQYAGVNAASALEKSQQLVLKFGDRIEGVFAVNESSADGMFTALQERFGKIDVLVNNAGTFEGGPLDELSIADWDRVINTNLRAPFLCTRLAMRMMKQQKSGRIINIGSISAHRVRPHSAPYSTSKHGILGLTQVTALEGREHGITCGCLQPGNILTERRDASESDVDQEPMISVDELAEVALLMATLPENVEMLEAIVLPRNQLYVGRG